MLYQIYKSLLKIFTPILPPLMQNSSPCPALSNVNICSPLLFDILSSQNALGRMPVFLKQLHGIYVTRGTKDCSQWFSLIKDYISFGSKRVALILYTQNLPNRTNQPILALILKACASLRLILLGKSLHAESIKIGMLHDLFIGTSLISLYAKSSHLVDARRVFDGMPVRNAVTYNAMVKGCIINDDIDSASEIFARLPERNPASWSVMIEGLAATGDTTAARELFDTMPAEMRTVVTWTVMVHGYTVNGEMEAASELFDRMPSKNAFVWSSMIAGYFKKHKKEAARAIFDRIGAPNLVNWNALIAGYTRVGCCEEALEAFGQMEERGVKPDEFTVVAVLSSCAQLGSLGTGQKVHELIDRRRITKNQFVQNGLVDMYAKCGDIRSAQTIFNGMKRRNVACWNTMISALASHGRSEEALELFARLERSEETPDAVTFLVILSSCTHGGFVKDGLEIFEKMGEYGVVAGVEHYGCLVDLLGRSGRLGEAYDVVKNMPMKPNGTVWGALLGSCRVHMDAEMAEVAANEVANGSGNDSECVTLSNIYTASGKWEDAEEVRRKMAECNLQKTPGCSSVVVGNTEHLFYAGAVV